MIAPLWTEQLAAPPAGRRVTTPAARAHLRAHGVDADHPDLPVVVHLADAIARTSVVEPGWASVDVVVPPGQHRLDRLARAIAAAAATLRHVTSRPVRAAVRSTAATAVLDDVHLLSTAGIRRRLTAATPTSGGADLDVVDGSDTGVTRLATSAARRPVVAIGAPARRVVPVEYGDDEVIAVRTVVEVVAGGGGVLDVFQTARLAAAVAAAITERETP